MFNLFQKLLAEPWNGCGQPRGQELPRWGVWGWGRCSQIRSTIESSDEVDLNVDVDVDVDVDVNVGFQVLMQSATDATSRWGKIWKSFYTNINSNSENKECDVKVDFLFNNDTKMGFVEKSEKCPSTAVWKSLQKKYIISISIHKNPIFEGAILRTFTFFSGLVENLLVSPKKNLAPSAPPRNTKKRACF